ncbi:hypothetical protein JTF06_13370 [Desemzia sp. RIT804]|uniref:hypothetical protein n=1 Tax=Desemzia sp. RIT 804 TaxID=2810209 RepID=UPI00194ED814|nr:hypothetical protein [Desemzia sp. RIT 804]MBM6615875.1 hypothetical protein [Desemzia sp. RIT 804]
MQEETRLPKNGKEFILFLGIISIISVNTIAPTIMGLQFGFTMDVYKAALKTMPFIWLIVLVLIPFIVEPIANKLVAKFTAPTDSFNSVTLFHTLFSVLMMSIILSVVAAWVGTRTISMEPITNFFYAWPRNFAVAFFIESLIAQPIARLAMKGLHKYQAKQSKIA